MEIRCLREEELGKWAQHCFDVFTTPYEYFVRHYMNDPRTDPNGIFIAVDGDAIVSSVRVFTRDIYVEGESVTMGGIGEVCTKSEYRKQGLSGALLRRAIEYMQSRGLCTSMLFTGSNDHYARYDWHTAPRSGYIIDAGALKPETAPAGTLRLMREDDWPAIRGLYDLNAPAYTGCVVRSQREYWDKWVRAEWGLKKEIYVYELDGSVRAYMQLGAGRDEHGTADMGEFAAAPGENGLLSTMLGMANAQGILTSCAMNATMCGELRGIPEEDRALMVRLNIPFTVRGHKIATSNELVRTFIGSCIMTADDF